LIAETISSLIVERNKSLPPLRPVDIGVMAPWRGQVWKIRERLRALGLSAVDVGTVEVCVALTVTDSL
jgi:superfamily I DNA and/or RNA helicase